MRINDGQCQPTDISICKFESCDGQWDRTRKHTLGSLWFYKSWALSKQSLPRKEDRRTTRRSAWATFQNLQEQRRNLEDRIHEDDLRDRAEARLHCVVLHLSNRLNYNYEKNQWWHFILPWIAYWVFLSLTARLRSLCFVACECSSAITTRLKPSFFLPIRLTRSMSPFIKSSPRYWKSSINRSSRMMFVSLTSSARPLRRIKRLRENMVRSRM